MTRYALLFDGQINKSVRIRTKLAWLNVNRLEVDDEVLFYSKQDADREVSILNFQKDRKLRLISEDELHILRVFGS